MTLSPSSTRRCWLSSFIGPITLIQNSTSSVLTDLYQCALDKEGWRITEPTTKAFPVIYDALKDRQKKRVVVIAHSQGTIVAAAVLKLLKQITQPRRAARGPEPAAAYAPPEFVYPDDAPLDLSEFERLEEAELAKLELYCFATCANVMTQYRPGVPYLEHFGNANDIVARLGMLAPAPDRWEVRIDGSRFVRPGAWGHLLNAHYLYPIADVQRQGRRRGGSDSALPFVSLDANSVPRLYGYINGGTPPA